MEAIKQLQEKYGQTAFGLIAVLIIWFAIVAPTLEKNRVDTQVLKDVATSVADAARLVSDAAGKVSSAADKLDRLERRAP